MEDPEAAAAKEIFYLTDEKDTVTQFEKREDGRDTIFFDNDLYKAITTVTYLNH